MIGAVAVGIPARDEAGDIGACLESVLVAAQACGLPVRVAVVADTCVDDTEEVARRALRQLRSRRVDGVVRAGAFGTAGGARNAALDLARSGLAGPPEELWLATTDADTVVSPDWLSSQVRWANRGVDAIAGLVQVAWTDDTLLLRDRHELVVAAGGVGLGHDHVHGANLGIRGSRWIEVGGCAALADGEDRDLWRRLQATGARLLGVPDVDVTTSPRLHGRVPAGFSGHLRRLVPEGGLAS